MNAEEMKKISKFLSFVLRHNPSAIDLELSNEGWADLEQLIKKAGPKHKLSKEIIFNVVKENDKQRFAISEDRKSIRANQGHSIKVDLKLEAVKPPEFLFHGTATRFWVSIQKEGLKSFQRNHVHLSLDKVTATKVGKRHGKVLILKIDAKNMADKGFEFFCSKNGVWLTHEVPPGFLSLLDEDV